MSRSFAIALFSFIALAQAVALVKDSVVEGHVKEPEATTVWATGSTQLVEWTFLGFFNKTTDVYLNYLDNGNIHPCIYNPLATDVPVDDGQVPVVVPDVSFGQNYVITLPGVSGGTSQQFTITGGRGAQRCDMKPPGL